jgi:hypothetical protein
MDAERTGFIAASCHNTSVAAAAYDQWFSFQRAIFQTFYRYKKCVEVEMGNMPLVVDEHNIG